MQKIMTAIGGFISKTLSSSDEASFGRFASLLTLLFCLGWDTSYVVFVMRHFKEFHFTAPDILAFGGVLMAEAGFCTIFYGVNKFTSMGMFNRDHDEHRDKQ